ALRGDRRAFATLLARYEGLVAALIWTVTGGLVATEDLAQESFLIAWTRLAALRERGQFRAWLCGIARNLAERARDRVRAEAKLSDPSAAAALLIDERPGPVESALVREERALVQRALQRLPEGYRLPVVLFYGEEERV